MKKPRSNNKANKQKSLARYALITGLVILVFSGFFYCRWKLNDPQRVFNAMLENSLKTRGVTKQSNQSDGFQNFTQITQLQNGGQNVARSITKLSQGEGTQVVTESIGTPGEDYIRWTEIETDQTNESGAPMDFNQVINVWGQTNSSLKGETNGQLFGEITLGIMPLGYLNPDDRKEILDDIKTNNIYEVDYEKVNKEIIGGRPTYKFNVKMKPEAYVSMLKKFANKVGLSQLDGISTESFKDSPAAEMIMTVDVWSRQLTGIELSGSGQNEVYGSYGAKAEVKVPEEAIPIDVLQQKLQSVQ